MHNSLFGGISGGFVTGSGDMYLGSQLTLATAFINHQNQQIRILIDTNKQNVQFTTYIKNPLYKSVSKKSI